MQIQIPPPTRLQLFKQATNRLAFWKRHTVHAIIIQPLNVQLDLVTSIAVENALKHIRAWTERELKPRTFNFDVKVYQSTHDESWFANNPSGNDRQWWYWNNALQDANDLAGAGFYQYYDTWMVYVDAPIGTGQTIGGASGGYTSGVSVMDRRDLENIIARVCGSLGGSAHELYHTLGLPHPPAGDPRWPQALMGTGYVIYPRCVLLAEDKITMRRNPFIVFPRGVVRPPLGLCPL